MEEIYEMDSTDCYYVMEETANGPVVVGVMTAAEIDAENRKWESTCGICQDIASLPVTAHVDQRALAKMLGRSTKSIQRAIRRGDLPRPFRFMGKCVWLVGTILEHLQTKQKAVLEKAARHAKQLERHVA